MKDPMLSGRDSLRHPGERRAFITCLAMLPITFGLVTGFLSEAITPSRLILLAVGALLYVSIARGKLLGDSIHVHGGQLAEVSALVRECAVQLDVPVPQVFVRDDVNVPISAVGVAEPYALVISSHWLHHLHDEELRFLVTRELVHIRAGHTRLSSVLSVNGRENPAVSLVFGAYLRRTEYTADRVAYCFCGSIQAAIQAIAIASYHNLGRKINLGAVAEQLRELRSEPTLRARMRRRLAAAQRRGRLVSRVRKLVAARRSVVRRFQHYPFDHAVDRARVEQQQQQHSHDGGCRSSAAADYRGRVLERSLLHVGLQRGARHRGRPYRRNDDCGLARRSSRSRPADVLGRRRPLHARRAQRGGHLPTRSVGMEAHSAV